MDQSQIVLFNELVRLNWMCSKRFAFSLKTSLFAEPAGCFLDDAYGSATVDQSQIVLFNELVRLDWMCSKRFAFSLKTSLFAEPAGCFLDDAYGSATVDQYYFINNGPEWT
ncbi:hypothetical protein [Aquibacillus albus]|uniref:hypothetical protein n=1 Tax=Aquibacillus albus TaxID=1168171 RepID=UPI00195EAF23|nr:hypothetical protein [Aquibacillus albus]